MAIEMETWHGVVVLAVSGIGFLTVVGNFLKFLKWAWSVFLRAPKDPRDYGSWAVITGCTDGIGRALAFQLASKGLNLVLVGRNLQKLEATSDEIRKSHGGQIGIRSVIIDLAKLSGREVETKMRQGIEGLDVGLLINNAGMANSYATYFHDQDVANVDDIIKVNMSGATWVARAVLPGMLSKRKGAIVNIGSGSSVVVPSFPLATVYAASKAYIAMLSRSMSLEYQHHGIDVQCQIPLVVATKMPGIAKPSLFIPSPEEYSKASIRWLGRDHLCSPYWAHAIQSCIFSLYRDDLLSRIILKKHLAHLAPSTKDT